MVLKAIADGAVFEICYGAAMRSASAANSSGDRAISKDARRNIIAGARELIRVTNGKGVIISSEVRKCMEVRGPLDLCNL
jgi:ribonuclease P/MRP protein subunit RPP1